MLLDSEERAPNGHILYIRMEELSFKSMMDPGVGRG